MNRYLKYIGKRDLFILNDRMFSKKYCFHTDEVLKMETEEDFLKALRIEADLMFERISEEDVLSVRLEIEKVEKLKKAKINAEAAEEAAEKAVEATRLAKIKTDEAEKAKAAEVEEKIAAEKAKAIATKAKIEADKAKKETKKVGVVKK